MKQWCFVNYMPVINAVSTVPAEQLMIYPASDGYTLQWNSRGIVAEQFLSSVENASKIQEMYLINTPGRINGMDQQQCEKSLPLTVQVPVERFANVKAQKITLKRCMDIPPDSAETVVLFYSKDAYSSRTFRKKLYELAADPEKILLLNNWFGGHILHSRNPAYVRVWYIAPGGVSQDAWNFLTGNFSENITLYMFMPQSEQK